MSYPFPHITEHKVYPRTFLHRVEARFHYVSSDKDFCEKLAAHMEHFFGLKYTKGRFEAMALAPVRISRDDTVRCKITDDFVEISFDHDGYISYFDSLDLLAKAFEQFFISVDARIIKLSLRKTNVLPISAEFEGDKALNQMFSPEFMAFGVENNDFSDQLTGDTHRFVSFLDDKEEIRLQIMACLEEVEGMKEIKALAMHSLASFTHDLPAQELSGALFELNKVLYDAFHWAIKSNLLEMLKQEEEA